MGVWDHGSGEWSTSERGGFTHALGPAGTMVVARDSDWLHKGVYYPESHARARPLFPHPPSHFSLQRARAFLLA